MSAVHWFKGGSGTTRIRSMPAFEACFRSYKGDQAQQGSVIERLRDRRLGGGAFRVRRAVPPRLLAFLSSSSILTEHTPCSRIGMVTRLGCAQWLIQRE